MKSHWRKTGARSLLPNILILRTCQARVSRNANSAKTLVSVVPKNAKNAQRGREQARDNPAADRGSWPPWRCNVVALVQSSKSFAMRIYETRTGVNFFFY